MEDERPTYALTSRTSDDFGQINSDIQDPSRNLQPATASTSVLDSDTPETPSDRVSQAIKDVASDLEDLIPSGFKISTT